MAFTRAIHLPEVIIITVDLSVLIALLSPQHTATFPLAQKSQSKKDTRKIAEAVTAFGTEYGRLPGSNSGAFGGEALAALTGSDKTINPRQIVFLEVQPARKGWSGITNGTFVDPWGGAYQIAFAEGTNTQVTAGTNGVEVPKRVAVWNDPRLEKIDQNWLSAKKPKSRYVTSWD